MSVELKSQDFLVDFNQTVFDSEVRLIVDFRHFTTEGVLEVNEIVVAIFLLENVVAVIDNVVREVRSDSTEVTVFDVQLRVDRI